jgi:hypothetical protein
LLTREAKSRVRGLPATFARTGLDDVDL